MRGEQVGRHRRNGSLDLSYLARVCEDIGAALDNGKSGEDYWKPIFGGTVLVIAISRDLAPEVGGDLGVESAEGVGSTFTVSQPLARP